MEKLCPPASCWLVVGRENKNKKNSATQKHKDKHKNLQNTKSEGKIMSHS